MKIKFTLFILLLLANISFSYAKHNNPAHKNSFPFATHPDNKALAPKLKPRTRGQVSEPGNAKNYSWMDTTGLGGFWEPNNDGLGVLIHNSDEVFSYDTKGNLVTDLNTDTTGVYIMRTQYTYDAANRETLSSEQTWNGSSWNNESQDIYTYDAQGNQILDLTQEGSGTTWTNQSQTISSYSDGNDTLDLTQTWNGSGWVNKEQYRQMFDANENETLYMDQEWNGTVWVTEYGTKDTYTYDGNNHIISDITQNYEMGNWKNYIEFVYTVDGTGAWSAATEQQWTGAAWANLYHIYNITWEDFSSESPYSYTLQGFSTGSWKDSVKFSATYDSYGGSVAITQLMISGSWVNSERISEVYDSHYNNISLIAEVWLGGNWQVEGQENSNYTYSVNNDVLRIVYQRWNDDLESVVNWNRMDYSNFQYFTVNGVENVNATKLISIYPNPTSTQLNISLDKADFKVASISIFNFLGQNVMGTNGANTSSSNISIPVSELPAGIYFVRLTGTDKSTFTKKFVKQ